MKNSMVMFTLFVFERYSLLWKICFKKSKLFLEAKIWNPDLFEYVKFDGDVIFSCFRHTYNYKRNIYICKKLCTDSKLVST